MIKENQDNNHKNNIDPTSKLAKTQNNLPNGKTTMVKDLLAQASQAFFFAPVDKKNSSMPLSSTDIENTLTNEEQEQIINYEYNIEQLDNLENLSNSRHDFANPLAPSNVFNHTHKILQPSPNQYPILNLHQNSLTYSSNIKHYFHESNPIDLVVKSLLTEAASPIAAPITIVPPIATSTTATPIFVPPVPTMPAPTPSPAPASTPTPTPPPAPTSTPPSAPTPTPPPAPTLAPTLEEAKQNFEAAINGLNEAVSQNQNLLSWGLTIFNPSAKFTETDDFEKILKEYQAKDSSENVIAAAEKATETQQQFNAISQEAAQKAAEQAEETAREAEQKAEQEAEEAAQKEAAEKAAQKAAQKAAEQAEQEKAAQKAAEQAEQEKAAQKAAEQAELEEAAQQENDISQPDDENETVDKETAPELVNSSSQEEATPLTPTLEEAKQNFEAAINGLNEAVSQNQNLLSWGLTIFNPSAKFTETDDFAKILKEYQAKDSSENVIAAAEKATETQQQFNAISQEAAQKAAEQAEETEQKAAEQAEQEKAAQKAAEQAEQEEAAQKAAEQAEQEEAAQKAAEQAEQEKAAQKAAEQEEAAQEAAEKVEQEEAAQKEAAEKAAQEAAEKVEQEEAAKKAEPEKAAYEAAEQVEAEENQQSSDVKDNSNSYLSSLKNLFNFSNNVASNSTIQNGELKMPNKKLDELSEQASILEEKISKIKENVFQLNNKLETESIKLNTAREKIKLIEESDSIIAETFKKFHFYLHENSLNYQANYEGIAKALEQNQPARKTLIATVKEAQAAQQEVNSVNNKLNSTQKILDEFNAQLNEINQKINNESQANDLNDFEVINHQDVITKTPEEVKQKITHLQAELNNTNENLGSRENDYNENLRTINDKSKELPGETKKLINPEDLAAEQQYFQDKANKLESLAQLSSQSDELAGKINLSKSAVTEAENAEVLAQYKTQYLWNFTQPTGYKEAKNNLALKQAELQDLYDQQTVIKFDEEKLMKEIGIEDINIEEIDPKQLDDFQQNYSQIISNIETLSQYKVEVENYTNEKISIEQEITNYQQQLPLDLPLENLSDNASDSSATTSLAPEDHQPQIGDVTSQDNSNIWLPNEHHVGLEDASPEIY